MLISYRWLQRHIDLTGLSAEEIARSLTLHTAEVEGVEKFAPQLSDVVVGHVLERKPHPDADKLGLCQVDVGADAPLGIVCGAPNVGAGQRVAVARIGTRLPGDVKIKKSKIRGQESNGMICSERELGLGDEHDGIWVLPEAADSAKLGASVAEALGTEDWVIEIDNKSVTHRPDLWGHRGFAAELAAIYERPLLPLDLTLPETGNGASVPVEIESSGCSRYIAMSIDGVKAEPSPVWMKLLLLAVGQRPIDQLVDVSNFVMLDLGQPNHLFDRTQLSESGIAVRDARPQETLVTLDGEERKLDPADMLICSGDTPVALAGVIGGEDSKVQGETGELLLEVAAFHATTVRRTAMRLGLRTDASARFEKSLDPTLPLQAAAHVVRTLKELQPSLTLPAGMTDAGDWSDPARVVTLRPDRVRSMLGVDVSDDDIQGYLTRLGFGVERGAAEFAVQVPSARAMKDVTIEEDLVEEVGRMVQYGCIEERPLVAAIQPLPRDPRRELIRKLQDELSGGARFHEVLTYSFLPEELAVQVRAESEEYVLLQNPVSDGWQRMRRSVVPSLLGRVAGNARHRDDVRIFEIGKGTLPERRDERGKPAEIHELALAWCTPRAGKNARFDDATIQRLKGTIDSLVAAVELPPLVWGAAEASELKSWAHSGRASVGRLPSAEKRVKGQPAPLGEAVVLLAVVDPEVSRNLGVDGDLAAAAISVDGLVDAALPRPAFQPLPKFPGTKIDVALEVPAACRAAEVVDAITKAGKGLAREIELFDLYQGERIAAGRKSLAYHVLLQSDDRTLTDKEGQKFLGRLERLMDGLDGRLRKE